jgi:hypothetical protein
MNANVIERPVKSPANLWLSGLLGGAVGLVGSLAIYGIARLLDLPLLVSMGPPGQSAPVPMAAGQIIIVVLTAALAATVSYALLRRFFGPRAQRIFQIVALVVLLLSFGAPMTQAVSTINKLLLALMHLVTGIAIVWALAWRR